MPIIGIDDIDRPNGFSLEVPPDDPAVNASFHSEGLNDVGRVFTAMVNQWWSPARLVTKANELATQGLETISGAGIPQVIDPRSDPMGASPYYMPILVSLLTPKRREEGFDPIVAIQGTRFEQFPQFFLDVTSEAELNRRKIKVDQELSDREALSGLGFFQSLGLSVALGFADPINWIPMAGVSNKTKQLLKARRAVKGAELTRRMLVTDHMIASAAAGAAGMTIEEAMAQWTLETQTAGESAMNIGAASIIAGVFGGVVGTVGLRGVEFDRLSRAVENDLTDTEPMRFLVQSSRLEDQILLSQLDSARNKAEMYDFMLSGMEGTKNRPAVWRITELAAEAHEELADLTLKAQRRGLRAKQLIVGTAPGYYTFRTNAGQDLTLPVRPGDSLETTIESPKAYFEDPGLIEGDPYLRLDEETGIIYEDIGFQEVPAMKYDPETGEEWFNLHRIPIDDNPPDEPFWVPKRWVDLAVVVTGGVPSGTFNEINEKIYKEIIEHGKIRPGRTVDAFGVRIDLDVYLRDLQEMFDSEMSDNGVPTRVIRFDPMFNVRDQSLEGLSDLIGKEVGSPGILAATEGTDVYQPVWPFIPGPTSIEGPLIQINVPKGAKMARVGRLLQATRDLWYSLEDLVPGRGGDVDSLYEVLLPANSRFVVRSVKEVSLFDLMIDEQIRVGVITEEMGAEIKATWFEKLENLEWTPDKDAPDIGFDYGELSQDVAEYSQELLDALKPSREGENFLESFLEGFTENWFAPIDVDHMRNLRRIVVELDLVPEGKGKTADNLGQPLLTRGTPDAGGPRTSAPDVDDATAATPDAGGPPDDVTPDTQTEGGGGKKPPKKKKEKPKSRAEQGPDPGELLPNFGIATLARLLRISPSTALYTSKSAVVRKAAWSLLGGSVFTDNGVNVRATDNVRSNITATRGEVAWSIQEARSQYSKYLQRMKAQAPDEVPLTKREFFNEAGAALAFGDVSPRGITEASNLAKWARDNIFEPWTDKAIEVGALDADVREALKTSKTYLHRLYRLGDINDPSRLQDWLDMNWEYIQSVAKKPVKREFADRIALQMRDSILHNPAGRGFYELDYFAKVGKASPLQTRKWNIKDELLIKYGFLETDITEVIRHFQRTIAPDVEIAFMFGDPLMDKFLRKGGLIDKEYQDKISDILKKKNLPVKEKAKQVSRLERARVREKSLLEAARDTLRNRLNAPSSTGAVYTPNRYAHMLLHFNTLRFLGKAWLSSIPDAAKPIMANNFLAFNKGYVPFIRDLLQLSKDKTFLKAMQEQRDVLGVGLEFIMGGRFHSLAGLFDNEVTIPKSKFEAAIETGSEAMGFISGLNGWTAVMKQFSGVVTAARIFRDIDSLLAGSIKKADLDNLNRLGITEADAKDFQAALKKYGTKHKGVWITNAAEWKADPEFERAYERLRRILVTETDAIIVTPHAGSIPFALRRNMFLRLMFQYSSFGFSSITDTLIVGAQRLRKGEMDVLMGMSVMVGLGSLAVYVKALAGGEHQVERLPDPSTPEGAKWWVMEGISQSGILAYFDNMNDIVEGLSAHHVGLRPLLGIETKRKTTDPDISRFLMGPTYRTAEQVTGLLRTVAAVNPITGERGLSASDVHNIRQLIPLQNHFMLDRLVFDKVEDAVVEMNNLPRTNRGGGSRQAAP